MYVTQTDACTMPNGLIPPTPAAVAAAQAAVASTETQIQTAQQAMDSVNTRPDMGPVVTSRGRFFTARTLANWPQGNNPKQPSRFCGPSGTLAVATHQGNSAATTPVSPPLTTRPLGPAIAAPTTGNPCLDVELGYATQSQLSAAMLWKCTQNGYFKPGVRPLVPPVAILANQNALPKLADTDVPPFDPSMMAGMGDVTGGPGSFVLWASLGFGAAALWLAHQYAKGHR